MIPKKTWEKNKCAGFPTGSLEDPNEEILNETVTDFLLSEHQYKPIFPDKLLDPSYRSVASDFENEYYQRLSLLDNHWGYKFTCEDKIVLHSVFFDFIEDISLNIGKSSNFLISCVADSGDGHWSNRVPIITYMSVLAEFMSKIDSDLTQPSTDDSIYRDLVYLGQNNKTSIPGISFNFNEILPVPNQSVSLEKIIDFKKEYETELLNFQNCFFKLSENVSKSKTEKEMKELVMDFEKSIKCDINDIKTQLQEYKIQTVLGSLNILTEMKVPMIIATAGVAAGVSVNNPTFIELGFGGLAAASGIKISNYLVDRNIQKRKIIRDSPFGYVYKIEGILTSTK
jgi:hypothetical protein